jgi:uncharacterized protein
VSLPLPTPFRIHPPDMSTARLNAPAWLPDDFDEDASLRFRRPFHTFLVKVSSLCNLNCTYCYVYQSPDDSWRWKPKFLDESTAFHIASRVQEHVKTHELHDVTIVFHGGEPLLLGLSSLRVLVDIFSAQISCKIHWGMQTNGTLLDDAWIGFFIDRGFRIGLSLDGSREQNDKHRLYHNGEGAYDDTVCAIRRLTSHPKWKQVFGGVLVVVDVDNSPADILATLAELGIHSANLILPDGHHDALPPKWLPGGRAYGAWLCEFFDLWYRDFSSIEIPYFEQIVALMLGGTSSAEEIGAQSVDLIVVDTNGDIEAVDTLKIVGRAATSLSMNVTSHSFDQALSEPAIYSRMSGFGALSGTCRRCEYLESCGGGYLPHRYDTANGFINPSVYCADLKALFSHMRTSVFLPDSPRAVDAKPIRDCDA